jgi:hypothetical protein
MSIPIQDGVSCSACKDAGDFCSDKTLESFREVSATAGRNTRCCMTNRSPYSVFIPRSQGTNTARELAGWEEFIHQYDVGCAYVTTGHVLGYYRSFRPQYIARELFGESTLRFAGSQVADRGPCELLADNFGLSDTMRGVLTIDPVIENIVFDNQVFIGLDPLLCGLYLRFHMPIVYTRWNLNLCQKVTTGSFFPMGYMGLDEVAASNNIIKVLEGQHTFGDMKTPWSYGRIFNGLRTKTGVADIDCILGYDVCQTDTYHVGLYTQLVLPTGNKLTGRELFQPLVGNGHHVEWGLGVSGHVVLLEHDVHSNLAFYLEGNAVHLFKNTQMRSFDFCKNGPLSRYMLLKELTETDGVYSYTGSLINAINFATRPVSVSVPIKGDISAKFAVRTPHIIADLGYNFYGRVSEHVSFQSCDEKGLYAVKGSEGANGLEYAINDMEFGSLIGKVPLNSSQSSATIRREGLTDNPQPVGDNPSTIVVTPFSRQEGPIEGPGVTRAFMSVPPRIVTVRDLHKSSGTSPEQATHKIFGYLGYNFYEHDWCANPYLGIGGELEIDALHCEDRSSLNQWSVWIKGGFEF